MGRLIDEDILIDSIPDLSVFEQEDFGTPDMIRLIEDAPTVQAIPKADYEKRLKADMVVMLEEIDLEMSEQSFGIQTEPWEVVEKLRKKIIKQKINALKAEAEGT